MKLDTLRAAIIEGTRSKERPSKEATPAPDTVTNGPAPPSQISRDDLGGTLVGLTLHEMEGEREQQDLLQLGDPLLRRSIEQQAMLHRLHYLPTRDLIANADAIYELFPAFCPSRPYTRGIDPGLELSRLIRLLRFATDENEVHALIAADELAFPIARRWALSKGVPVSKGRKQSDREKAIEAQRKRAHDAIRRLAADDRWRERGYSYDDLKRLAVMAGIIDALFARTEPRRWREGSTGPYLKVSDGRVAWIAPIDRPLVAFWGWFVARVLERAGEWVIDTAADVTVERPRLDEREWKARERYKRRRQIAMLVSDGDPEGWERLHDATYEEDDSPDARRSYRPKRSYRDVRAEALIRREERDEARVRAWEIYVNLAPGQQRYMREWLNQAKAGAKSVNAEVERALGMNEGAGRQYLDRIRKRVSA